MITDNWYDMKEFTDQLNNDSLRFDNDNDSLFYFLVDRGQKVFYPSYLDRFNIVPSVQSEESLHFDDVADRIEHHIHTIGNVEMITDNVVLDFMDRAALNATNANKDSILSTSYRVYLLDASKDCRTNYQSELADPDKALKLIHTALVFVRGKNEPTSCLSPYSVSCLWPCSFSASAYDQQANIYDQEITKAHLPIIPTTVKRILDLAESMQIDYQGLYLTSSPGLKSMQFSYHEQDGSGSSKVWSAQLGILNPNKTLDEIKQAKYQEMLKSLGLPIKKADN